MAFVTGDDRLLVLDADEMFGLVVVGAGAVLFLRGMGIVAEFLVGNIFGFDRDQTGKFSLCCLVLHVGSTAARQGDSHRFLLEHRFIIDLAGNGVFDRSQKTVCNYRHAVFVPEIGLGGVMAHQVAR